MFPLLFVLVLPYLKASASNFSLYAINPFSISVSGHSGLEPFGLTTLNPQEIHEGPILILAPEFEEQPNTKILHAFFVPYGMRSLGLNSKFEPLYKSFLQFKLSGLVLYPGSIGDRILAQSKIKDVTTPDLFKATELLRFIENPSIPIVYIAPTEIFNSQYFPPLDRFAIFSFQEKNVVLSEVFGTFYFPLDKGNVLPVTLDGPHQGTQQEMISSPTLKNIQPKDIS